MLYFWISYALVWALLVFNTVILGLLVKRLAGRMEGASVGLEVGAEVPAMAGKLIDGHDEVVLELSEQGPALVVFLATACAPCREVRGIVREVAEVREGEATVVVCCMGKEGEVRDFAGELGGRATVLADQNGEMAAAWRVFRQPTAMGVDEEGRLCGTTVYIRTDSLNELVDCAILGS